MVDTLDMCYIIYILYKTQKKLSRGE